MSSEIKIMELRNNKKHMLKRCCSLVGGKDMERWTGRTAVVTGASSGIGAALSVRLANHGITVVGLARRVHLVEKLKTKVTGAGKIVPRQCDISKVEEIVETFQWVQNRFGGTDIMVNNAGIFKPGKITDTINNQLTNDSVLLIMDVNYKGLVMCTRQAIASMNSRNFDGHLININSLAGHYIPFHSDFNVYSSTKHAVTAFTAALLNEMADAKRKIKITSISPGLVRTEITRGAKDDVPILEPDEVVDAIVYALSTPPNVNAEKIEDDDDDEAKPNKEVPNWNTALKMSSFNVQKGDGPCSSCLCV